MSVKKERVPTMTLVWGRNGTGKSYFLDQRLQKVANATNRKCLVVTYDNTHKQWQKYPKVHVGDKKNLKYKGIKHTLAKKYETLSKSGRINKYGNQVFEHILENFRNGIIAFDDCKLYTPPDIMVNFACKQLFINFRPLMADIYFVTHSPKDVPPQMWQHVSFVFVGPTDTMLDKSVYKSSSHGKIIEAQEKVNELYQKALLKGDKSHFGIFKRVVL